PSRRASDLAEPEQRRTYHSGRYGLFDGRTDILQERTAGWQQHIKLTSMRNQVAPLVVHFRIERQHRVVGADLVDDHATRVVKAHRAFQVHGDRNADQVVRQVAHLRIVHVASQVRGIDIQINGGTEYRVALDITADPGTDRTVPQARLQRFITLRISFRIAHAHDMETVTIP